jgi:hypothetical protein
MASEEVCIHYELGQHGWAQFQLNVGTDSIVVGPFGYCTDALGDLVRAALMIATSGWRAEVSFDGEPTEWRLIAGPHWDPTQSRWTDFRLRVLIVYDSSPGTEGEKVFEAQCSADAFVHAVLRAAQAVWDKYGADGYDGVWGGPRGFPLRALSALKAALLIQEPRV